MGEVTNYVIALNNQQPGLYVQTNIPFHPLIMRHTENGIAYNGILVENTIERARETFSLLKNVIPQDIYQKVIILQFEMSVLYDMIQQMNQYDHANISMFLINAYIDADGDFANRSRPIEDIGALLRGSDKQIEIGMDKNNIWINNESANNSLGESAIIIIHS
jgi:hypothetical protein